MNKAEALENIKSVWEDNAVPLGEKIIRISSEFYSAGLDVAGTASYIHTTESELDAFLALSEFEDSIIEKLSIADPPKTTWTILASASDDEIEHAIEAINEIKEKSGDSSDATDEYVFNSMIEISGPTKEQKVANLSGDTIRVVLKKGQDFRLLTDYDSKFLNSIAAQKKRGKVLSEKQTNYLIKVLVKLIEGGAIQHGSIDGDQEICEEILKAMEL